MAFIGASSGAAAFFFLMARRRFMAIAFLAIAFLMPAASHLGRAKGQKRSKP